MKIVFLILMSIGVLNAEFVRDNTTGIVKDTTKNLEWQDDVISTKMTWQTAISYCEGLNLDGNGWRLPNINQMNSIIDYSNYPAIKNAFTQIGHWYYFSSTTNLDQTNAVFLINHTGDNAYGSKKDQQYVRCVRPTQ